ncbi:MAG: YDG domain-containing protein [Prevotellaceae bacterium]|nr:YDG domain-containing protein [Prevotellaceae bacterium]
MKKVFLSLLLGAALATSANAGGRIYVSGNGDDSNGQSWVTAYKDLQVAINAATASDEIWVAAGIYKPTRFADNTSTIAIDDRNCAFVMKAGVKIYGGFVGIDPDEDLNDRDWKTNLTVLSGNIKDEDEADDNTYHVVIAAGSMIASGDTARLDGFVITGGYADGEGTTIQVHLQTIQKNYGGGIYSIFTRMVFANDSIGGNYSVSGGGINASADTSTYANVIISSNSFQDKGGGVYVNNGAPTFTCTHISGNLTISGARNSNGCGVYVNDGIPTFANTHISENEASEGGGGVYVNDGIPIFTNVRVSSNTAPRGGGIHLFGGNPTFAYTVINGNKSATTATGDGGGGVYAIGTSSAQFSNTLISGNQAARTGGGVFYNSNKSLTFINTTIANNYAHGNDDVNHSGGVHIDAIPANESLILSNSIIGENVKRNVPVSNVLDTKLSIYKCNYSIISQNIELQGLISTDNPLFVRSSQATNSNPTTDGDYHLQPGSPAIDMGWYDIGEEYKNGKDLGDSARLKGCAVDIGAYESPYRLIQNDPSGIVYVNKIKDMDGANNGSSWEDAYPDLAAPLFLLSNRNSDCSEDIKEIWVAEGEYKPQYMPMTATAVGRRDQTFTLVPGLKLYGGFPAGANDNDNSTIADRNWKAHPTVLSGKLSATDSVYHVVLAVGNLVESTDTARLDGFVVKGGRANDGATPVQVEVGGVAKPVSRQSGGGIYVAGAAMHFANDSVVDNAAITTGGGIYASEDTSTYAGVVVSENTATTSGGGVYIASGKPAYANVIVSGNTATTSGGGVAINGGKPNFTNALISGNVAKGTSGNGGGVYANSALPIFTNATIAGNFAESNGGGVYVLNGTVSIQNSIVGSNSGGSITSGGGSFSVASSVIHGSDINGSTNEVPLFVSPDTATATSPSTGGNYRLRANSPALDTGDNSLNPLTEDLDGYTRKCAGKIDMGAYERPTINLKIDAARLFGKVYDGKDTVTVTYVKLLDDLAYGGDSIIGTLFGLNSSYAATGRLDSAGVVAGGGGQMVKVAISLLTGGSINENRYSLMDTLELTGVAVQPRPIEIAACDTFKTYGDPDPKVFRWELAPGSLPIVGSDAIEGTLTYAESKGDDGEGTGVGTYAIVEKDDDKLFNKNYAISYYSPTDSITVRPRPITIAACDTFKVYGDADPEKFRWELTQGSLVGSDVIGGTLTYEKRSASDNGVTTGVGTYAIVEVEDDTLFNENYEITYLPTDSITITPRPITVKADTVSKVYGRPDPELVWVKLTPADSLVGDDELTGRLTYSNAGLEASAGKYEIVEVENETLSNPNYKVTYEPDSIEVKPAPLRVVADSVTVELEKVYNRTDHATVTQYQNALDSVLSFDAEYVTLSVTVKYEDYNVDEGIDITLTYAIDGGKSGNYELLTIRDTLDGAGKITPRELIVAGATISTSKVYDHTTKASGDWSSIAVTPISGDNVQFTVDSATYNSFTVDEANTIRVVYEITGGDGSGNYRIRDSVLPGGITPLQLVFRGNKGATVANNGEKTYDGGVGVAADALTVGGFNNLYPDDMVLLDTVATYDSAFVGNRKIVVSYAIASGGVNAGCYSAPKSDTIDGEILPAPLTVKPASGQSKIYGEDDPVPLEFEASGWVNGEGESLIVDELSRMEGDSVGTYKILAGGLSAGRNYKVTVAEDTVFTITPALLTVSPDGGQHKVYGDPDPDPLTFKASGWKYNDADNATTLLQGTLIREGGSDAGPYAITTDSTGLTLASNNYKVSVNADSTFTIDRRPVTLKADSASKFYGDADPELRWKVAEGSPNNLVANDKLSVELSYTATDVEAGAEVGVGQYFIEEVSAEKTYRDNPNYNITVETGVIAITPRPLTVRADTAIKTYGEDDPVLTWHLADGSRGYVGADTLLGGSLTYSDTSGRTGHEAYAGRYAVKLDDHYPFNNPNYDVSYEVDSIRILRAPLLVRPEADLSAVYGEAASLRFDASGWVNSDDTVANLITGALSREPGDTVGRYAITAGDLSAGPNYAVAVAAGAQLAITPAPLTVTPTSGLSKVYGDADPVLAYGVNPRDWRYDDANKSLLRGALAHSGGPRAGVGTYAIVNGSGDDSLSAGPNYAVKVAEDVTFGVTPRPISVKAIPVTKTYGPTDPNLGWEPATTSDSTVYGDTLVIKLTYTGTNVGVYPVIVEAREEDNPNYDITFENSLSTVTIRPAPLQVTPSADLSKIYGDDDPQLTYGATGWQYDDGGAGLLTGALGRAAGEDVGRYAVVNRSDADSLWAGANYRIVVAQGAALDILPTPQAIRFAPLTWQIEDGAYRLSDSVASIPTGRRAARLPVRFSIVGRGEAEDAALSGGNSSLLASGQSGWVELKATVAPNPNYEAAEPVCGRVTLTSRSIESGILITDGIPVGTDGWRFLVETPSTQVVTAIITPKDNGAKVIYNGVKYDGAASLPIDVSRAGVQLISYEVLSQDSMHLKHSTFELEQLLDFEQWVYVKWDNTMIIDVNRLKNEGYDSISSFQWYENGRPMGNGGPSYSRGNTKQDVFTPRQEYTFEIERPAGKARSTARVFEETFPGGFQLYPNPVQADGVLNIDANLERGPYSADQATVRIYNATGTLVHQTEIVNRHAAVDMSSLVPGVYFVRVLNWRSKIVVK